METATQETDTQDTEKTVEGIKGVTIVKAEKPLKINNPNLKVEIAATPSYPQFGSLQDAVNFAGNEAPVLEGVNTYVRNTVLANMRQKMRTAPEGSKVDDVVKSSEEYGTTWTFATETAETVKKSELIERQAAAIKLLEDAKAGADVDIDAILAALRASK